LATSLFSSVLLSSHKDRPHKVTDLSGDHPQKVTDPSGDHPHKVTDPSGDHPLQEDIVFAVLPHLLLENPRDHRLQAGDHKDLPKAHLPRAHHPSNLEFNDRYDQAHLLSKVLSSTGLKLQCTTDSPGNDEIAQSWTPVLKISIQIF
uniref:Uncharacterized protein n=1 Tax=Sus scrofa TaxID=9823 RepID=A0A8D1GN06_PIG